MSPMSWVGHNKFTRSSFWVVILEMLNFSYLVVLKYFVYDCMKQGFIGEFHSSLLNLFCLKQHIHGIGPTLEWSDFLCQKLRMFARWLMREFYLFLKWCEGLWHFFLNLYRVSGKDEPALVYASSYLSWFLFFPIVISYALYSRQLSSGNAF